MKRIRELINRIQSYIITNVLTKLLKYTIIRFLIAAVILWVGFVRSFFITERSGVICVKVGLPIIGLINGLLIHLDPEHFSIFTASIVYYYIGLQLITYDHLGALFAKLIAENDHPISLLMTPLLCKPRSNMVKRYVTFRAAMGLITGKGTMTSTGRAAIFVGALTSVTFLGDGILKRADAARARQEAREDAEKARLQASLDAARARQDARDEARIARQFEIYKARHATWQNSSWRTRGREPTWEEEKKE